MIEHDIITTSQDINREGERIPKGSQGTIVHIYIQDTVFEVEFNDLPNNPVIAVYKFEIT